jgi:DNA-binding transcriptional ArsR family regulator
MDKKADLKAAILQAMGQSTRVKILEMLRNGEECVCNIWPALGESQSNVSRHLAMLRSVGIVEGRHKGVSVYYQVTDNRIFDILDQVEAMVVKQAKETLKKPTTS